MKHFWHGIKDLWDGLSDDCKITMFIGIFVFTFGSFLVGSIKANKIHKGYCVFNTRAGKLNLPYRFGCYMFEELDKK